MPEGRVSCACWKRHLGTRGDKVKVKRFCRESGCVAFIAPLGRHGIQPPNGEVRKPSVRLPGLRPPNLRSVTWINVFRNSSNQPVAAIENDQMRELSANYQCIGLSELFGYTISGSYVYLDRTTVFLLPLWGGEEISISDVKDKTFLERFRRPKTTTKVLNERIATTSGPVCLIIRGSDGFKTDFDRVRCWAEECDHEVFFILLVKDNEYPPNKGAGLFDDWG